MTKVRLNLLIIKNHKNIMETENNYSTVYLFITKNIYKLKRLIVLVTVLTAMRGTILYLFSK